MGARFSRHLALTWVPDDDFSELDAALRSPLCRFLEGVTLTDYVTPEKVVEPLAALPRLQDVTLTGSLELISPGMLAKMVDHLVGLPHMTRLTLNAREVTAVLDKLAGFPRLQRLTLRGAWLQSDDVRVLRVMRERVAPGCVLRLDQTSVTLDVEGVLVAAWPFEVESASGPGLLVEQPAAERGRYLLAAQRDLRIGSHLACDLPIAGHGLRPVHVIFDGASLREAGNLDAPKHRLRDGDRVPVGGVTLRFCSDVAAARAAMQR